MPLLHDLWHLDEYGVDKDWGLPVSAIAVSSASADAGVFSLDFPGGVQSYLPFEVAGAIPGWRLDLSNTVRQFKYDTVHNAVLQLPYTSLDGGT
jgi:hypothetical protein